MKDRSKPVIGISIGDVNGIGPEIILKTFSDSRMFELCTPILYGSTHILNQWKKMLHLPDLSTQIIKKPEEHKRNKLNIIEVGADQFEITPGSPSISGAKLALSALDLVVEHAIEKKIDAVVTAPLNKHNISEASPGFVGHTEFLAQKCESVSLMILCSDEMRIAMVTGHVALMDVVKSITAENIILKIESFNRSLVEDFQISKPKIAVLGLNPHAGEAGVLGKEEEKEILPAIQQAKTKGAFVFGPYPSDGFFGSGNYQNFDGILAMYHDQALIPFKALCFENGVNFTSGLPVVRTSPDHGTAYTIAGKKTASEASFRASVYQACDIIHARRLREIETVESDS